MNKCFVLIDEQRRINAINYLKSLPVDSSLEVEFRPKKETRSQKQNAALFAVAYPPIMEAMGLRGAKDKEYLHEFFCGEYWGWNVTYVLGKEKATPVRTTTTDENKKRNLIDKNEMSDLYNFIQHKAADNGIYVPDPDPMYGLKR